LSNLQGRKTRSLENSSGGGIGEPDGIEQSAGAKDSISRRSSGGGIGEPDGIVNLQGQKTRSQKYHGA